MKKILAAALAALIILSAFAGCSETVPIPEDNRLRVVVTIFPEYDWVRQLIGDKADKYDLTMLLDSGVDLHNYQPDADDMLKISTCDLFIHVGGESDAWVKDALAAADNKRMTVIDLVNTLGSNAVEEEDVPEIGEGEDGEECEETEYDEHVWLSLKNARIFVTRIAEALAGMDKENKQYYFDNAKAYNEKLKALDSEYEQAAADAAVKTLVFTDRFPFRYLTEDYGLDYFAAFKGCSAESEASFKTVSFLASKVDELSVKNVIVIEGSDKKIAETVISNTEKKDQGILVLDSMQTTTLEDAENGKDYYSIMQSNLDVLKAALA